MQKLSETELDLLRSQSLKPEEIAGAPDVQLRRVQELIRWFARLSAGRANPKWTAAHAYELAYYIATTDHSLALDLGEIEKRGFVQGLNATESERHVAARLGMIAALQPSERNTNEGQ